MATSIPEEIKRQKRYQLNTVAVQRGEERRGEEPEQLHALKFETMILVP
jgi:hypothetical protein